MIQFTSKRGFVPLIFIIVVFIFLFFTSKFSPFFSFNYWSDINIYYSIGKSIWHGKVIYRDLFDHKGPLIFFIYSLGYIFSKTSFFGMFIVQVIFNSISVYYVYRSIRLINSNFFLAFVFSLFVFVFVLNRFVDGGSAEEFILTFELVSLYYFLKYFKSTEVANPKHMFIHGITITSVFFIKLSIVVIFFFPLLFILINIFNNEGIRVLLKNVLYLFYGFLLISVPIFGYFLLNGAVNDFISAYFIFNYQYSGQVKFTFIEFYRLIKNNLFMFSFIFFGLLFSIVRDLKKKKILYSSFFLAFLFTAFIVIPNSIILEYYILPLLFFMVVGIVFVLSFLIRERWHPIVVRNLLAIACLIYVVYSVYGKYSHVSQLDQSLGNSELYLELPKRITTDKLLFLSIGDELYLYTKLGIIPPYKYFFYPNVDPNINPSIRNYQTQYIVNKEFDYTIITDIMINKEYYLDLLKDNYTVSFEFKHPLYGYNFYLYQRKDL